MAIGDSTTKMVSCQTRHSVLQPGGGRFPLRQRPRLTPWHPDPSQTMITRSVASRPMTVQLSVCDRPLHIYPCQCKQQAGLCMCVNSQHGPTCSLQLVCDEQAGHCMSVYSQQGPTCSLQLMCNEQVGQCMCLCTANRDPPAHCRRRVMSRSSTECLFAANGDPPAHGSSCAMNR